MITIFNINNILDIQKERQFWKNVVLDNYITPKKVCSKCGKNSLTLNNYESIYNPII